ncbi:MAG: type II toxin-antitoxin system prevent-host-death family antitoxin [Candidatus Omnitrophica bacterium]|nr:type II toxin-antitoxin system prevent-host-death family antitoxin [Candidatus Omnitrophota bacterium]MCA9430528.1 type II toxin-antitoxin system prevent-host-death family antitoxin [Candidatus Omnitrophota bacterium]MCB9769561.1 type II toxin-antitoxin system prevent-host-death family antitoxin [Candidatus Omnitrophota bacterium]
MKAIPFDHAQANLEKTLDQVCDNRDPVFITRENNPSGVLISLEDYGSLDETVHLLRSPENAKRLLESSGQSEQDSG